MKQPDILIKYIKKISKNPAIAQNPPKSSITYLVAALTTKGPKGLFFSPLCGLNGRYLAPDMEKDFLHSMNPGGRDEGRKIIMCCEFRPFVKTRTHCP